MRENRIVNAGVGALILLAATAMMFIAFFASSPDWRQYDGYILEGNFDEAAGLKARAPIRIAGVKVGEVVSVQLTDSYLARVRMHIHSKDIRIAKDTSAHIFTEGLLGVRYIALHPGFDEKMLEDQDEIMDTNSGFVLESLIGQFMLEAQSEHNDDS